MRPLRVLLLQIREAADAMASHEAACVEARLGPERVTLDRRNALVDTAAPDWIDGYGAVVIGGSGDYSVHDPRSDAWVSGLRRVVDRLLATRVPAFGICFGHQLLAHHLGTAVATEPEQAEVGTVPLRLTDDGVDDPVFGVLGRSFEAHTGHSDHVTALPPDLTLMAQGDRCSHQAFRHRAAPFFTTQFHPDLSAAEAVSRYLAYRRELTPSAAAEAARRFRREADAAGALLGAFAAHAQQSR
jgi:GMP synthase (glutamine-hydrolysing)